MRLHKAFDVHILSAIFIGGHTITFGFSYFSLNQMLLLIEADEISIKIVKETTDYMGVKVVRYGHSDNGAESGMYTLKVTRY